MYIQKQIFSLLLITAACSSKTPPTQLPSISQKDTAASIAATNLQVTSAIKTENPPPPPELRTLEFVEPRKEGIEEYYPDEILPPIMDNRITESVPNDDIRAEAIEAPYEPDKVYDVVDEMPEFLPKGQLANFITDNPVYPENAREQGLEGVVKISFIVEKDGRVSGATILKSSNFAELDMEAIRVVKKMPRFAPGRINGKAVRCRMTLPITFVLGDR